MYTFIPYTNCPAFRQWLPCNAASHPDPAGWCKRLCSGPANHSAFRPAIFCFLLEIPIHFIFRLHPKYTKSQRSKPPPRFPGAGILLFAKGAPFAQFTKMSAKDGWAMLLWVHSAFRTFGVSCKSAPPSTVAQLNGLCLLHVLQHSANGHRAMQLRILTRQGGVNVCAPARWTHSVFRACGVSYTSFLLSAAGGLIEYVHVYTLHKLPGVQPMVTVQCSFAFWPGSVV